MEYFTTKLFNLTFLVLFIGVFASPTNSVSTVDAKPIADAEITAEAEMVNCFHRFTYCDEESPDDHDRFIQCMDDGGCNDDPVIIE